MEDNKHTPGPWRLSLYNTRAVFATDKNGQPVQICYCDYRYREEDEANAALICRAPDMAAQIESLQKVNESWAPLEKIAPPEKWLEMYTHYQEILTKADTAGWYVEQGNMALSRLSDLQKVNAEQAEEIKSLQISNGRLELRWCEERNAKNALQTENTALKQQVKSEYRRGYNECISNYSNTGMF